MFFLHPHIIFVIFFCYLFCNISYGQTIPKVDALRHSDALKKEGKSSYQTAYGMYRENIKIFETKADSSPQYRERIARSYLNAGNCMKMLELTDRATAEFDIAIKRYNEVVQNDLKYFTVEEKAKVLNRFGNVYYSYSQTLLNKGEITKSRDLNEQATQWYSKANYCKSKVLYTNHIANIFREEYNYKSVIEYAKKALQLFEDCDSIGWGAKADILIMLGLGYEGLERYDDAIREYSEALKYTGETREDSIKHTKALLNIGFAYTKKKELEQAKNYLNQALKIRKRINRQVEFNYWYASVYENLADIAIIEKDYESALNLYNNSIDNLKDNPTSEAPYIYNKPDLLRVLDLKAQAALKAKKIDLAYDTYQKLDNWINEFYKDLTTNQSKLTWIARTHTMYTHAIEVALVKNDKEKAFQYAEKARAVLLWQSHSQQAALSLLDEDKREKYDNLLAQIRQTDYKYRDAADKEKDELKTELDALNRQFDQFENSLGESYAQRKYQPKDITLDSVRADILNETTALVEYHWSADNMLYIFTLTKNDIHVDTVRLSDDFEAQIPKFLAAIDSFHNIVDAGYPIYQKAFAPVQTHLDKNHQNIQKIILLPDGKLNQIPFEALPTSPEKDSITHLIRNYTFNHLYSCDYSDSTYTNTIKTALLIAPEYGKADKLDSLSSIMKNKLPYPYLIALTGEVPKRDTVINQIPYADLIHIRAHAEQGTKNNGKIHLYDNTQLTQQDIQALDFKARHVVLDACETGMGKVSKGEGVLSLGWSFVYRGVPSVVMSLWKVNSSSTEILMENYYQQLKNGTPADEALRQAKLKLLDQRKTKKERVLEFLGIRKNQMKVKYAEPNHWAAFIHTGNPPSVQANKSCNLNYLLGTLLLLFLLIYTIRKTKTTQKTKHQAPKTV